MKIISFDRQADGNFDPQKVVTNMERLSFSDFTKAYGGSSMTGQPAGYAPAPAGYSLWELGRGNVVAIRDEL